MPRKEPGLLISNPRIFPLHTLTLFFEAVLGCSHRSSHFKNDHIGNRTLWWPSHPTLGHACVIGLRCTHSHSSCPDISMALCWSHYWLQSVQFFQDNVWFSPQQTFFFKLTIPLDCINRRATYIILTVIQELYKVLEPVVSISVSQFQWQLVSVADG